MDPLIEYVIPVSGLKFGSHSFDFQIDSEFFTHFPDSLIEEGNFQVHLDFEKRTDLYELLFSFQGTTKSICDRCLASVEFPISGENRLIVKFADDFLDDVDVIYIPLMTDKLNIAKYIYEFVCLGVPFVKIFDCKDKMPPPCDMDMLDLIEEKEAKEEEVNEKIDNPLWDQLKNIKFN